MNQKVEVQRVCGMDNGSVKKERGIVMVAALSSHSTRKVACPRNCPKAVKLERVLVHAVTRVQRKGLSANWRKRHKITPNGLCQQCENNMALSWNRAKCPTAGGGSGGL